MVEHASAFTVGNDLPTNPQTLFRCQCARTSVSWLSRLSLSIRGVSIHTLNIPTLSTKERNAPCIPIAEAKGFTARFDKADSLDGLLSHKSIANQANNLPPDWNGPDRETATEETAPQGSA